MLSLMFAAAAATSAPPPTRTQLLEAHLATEKAVAAVRSVSIAFRPPQVAGLHRHPVPVVGYVTSGAVSFQLEGQPMQILKEGDAFFEPAGKTVLRFDNATDEETTFVAFYLLGPGETETVQVLPSRDAK